VPEKYNCIAVDDACIERLLEKLSVLGTYSHKLSCEDSIVFESDFPKSEKHGGGTGTKSIYYAAEKYKGMAEFTAQDGLFRTRVLLHL
jgi:hypothetical protein